MGILKYVMLNCMSCILLYPLYEDSKIRNAQLYELYFVLLYGDSKIRNAQLDEMYLTLSAVL